MQSKDPLEVILLKSINIISADSRQRNRGIQGCLHNIRNSNTLATIAMQNFYLSESKWERKLIANNYYTFHLQVCAAGKKSWLNM